MSERGPRRELVLGGLPDEKLARVEGLASSRLLDPADPGAALNRRISILVMTREAEERMEPKGDGSSVSRGPDAAGPAGEAVALEQTPAAVEAAPRPPARVGPLGLPDLQKLAEMPKPREEVGVSKTR